VTLKNKVHIVYVLWNH